MLRSVFFRAFGAPLLALSFSASANGQRIFEPSILPDVPGFSPGDSLALTNLETFLLVAGAASLSYYLSGNDSDDPTYRYFRNGITEGDDTYIGSTTYGVERRLSPWFSLGIAGVAHVWNDASPATGAASQTSLGLGASTHARWYALGERDFSPYLEYGAGLFYGFDAFPADGTNFTFNLSTHLGVEYDLSPDAVLRFGYGNSHQSNNGYLEPNPGFDGNGFSFTYAVRL